MLRMRNPEKGHCKRKVKIDEDDEFVAEQNELIHHRKRK